MLYAILGRDAPGTRDKRAMVRPRHVERIDRLVEAGRLFAAGPFPAIDSPAPGPAGFVGSLIIAEFDSLSDAKAWAAADPRVVAVCPWNWAGCPGCNGSRWTPPHTCCMDELGTDVQPESSAAWAGIGARIVAGTLQAAAEVFM